MSPNPANIIVNIYDIALILSGLLAFGAIVFGAIKYTLAAGNPSEQHEGREWITQAILGVLLLFGAYLILHTINPRLVDGLELKVEQLKISPPDPNAPPAGTCQGGCQSISQNVSGLKCKDGCNADIRVIEKLNCVMRKAERPAFWVTEALPVAARHTSRCHQNGCCIDVALTNYNPSDPNKCAKVDEAYAQFRACGFKIINEYESPCGRPIPRLTTGNHLHIEGC